LIARIDERLSLDPVAPAVYRLPAGEGAALHLLHERARVLAVRYEGEEAIVETESPESVRLQLAGFLSP
jgi:hypothetical protein